MSIDTTFGKEGNASLRIGRFVFRQEFKFIVLVFEIADVAITANRQYKEAALQQEVDGVPFSSKVEALCSVIPERHADPRYRIQHLKASHWFFRVSDIP